MGTPRFFGISFRKKLTLRNTPPPPDAGWLVGWVAGWLVGWLAGLVGWAGWLVAGWLAGGWLAGGASVRWVRLRGGFFRSTAPGGISSRSAHEFFIGFWTAD